MKFLLAESRIKKRDGSSSGIAIDRVVLWWKISFHYKLYDDDYGVYERVRILNFCTRKHVFEVKKRKWKFIIISSYQFFSARFVFIQHRTKYYVNFFFHSYYFFFNNEKFLLNRKKQWEHSYCLEKSYENCENLSYIFLLIKNFYDVFPLLFLLLCVCCSFLPFLKKVFNLIIFLCSSLSNRNKSSEPWSEHKKTRERSLSKI